eukprot:11157160-Lingulodinium_polyedra.AAC.1
MVPPTVNEDAAPCNKTTIVACKSFASLLGAGDEKMTKSLRHNTIKKAGVDAAAAWVPPLADLENPGA